MYLLHLDETLQSSESCSDSLFEFVSEDFDVGKP